MNELIKVNYEKRNTVSGRDLHKCLEIKERYQNWFNRMLNYGFIESQDYSGCKLFNTQANVALQDHQLTLDMAKEISMLQRNEKGRQARQYFIECEKKLKLTYEDINKIVDKRIKELFKTKIIKGTKRTPKLLLLEDNGVQSFITDCLLQSSSDTKSVLLYKYYIIYCDKNKYHPLGRNYFINAMKESNLTYYTKNGKSKKENNYFRGFKNIKLKDKLLLEEGN